MLIGARAIPYATSQPQWRALARCSGRSPRQRADQQTCCIIIWHVLAGTSRVAAFVGKQAKPNCCSALRLPDGRGACVRAWIRTPRSTCAPRSASLVRRRPHRKCAHVGGQTKAQMSEPPRASIAQVQRIRQAHACAGQRGYRSTLESGRARGRWLRLRSLVCILYAQSRAYREWTCRRVGAQTTPRGQF